MAMIRRAPAAALRGHVSSYYGFREETGAPLTRREGPGADVVVILTFEDDWLIDGERRTSFVGGLRNDQVTTEHAGRSFSLTDALGCRPRYCRTMSLLLTPFVFNRAMRIDS